MITHAMGVFQKAHRIKPKYGGKNMKKYIALLLLAALLLTGCTGTTVVIGNCTCPTGSHDSENSTLAEGAVKTGLALVTSVTATDAGEADGSAEFDVTLVAVLVDENGVIADCAIDSIGASVTFDASGAITSDVTAEVLTKNEKGDSYGMVAWGGAVAEWYAQAEALAQYAIGKTVSELKNGAIDESGYAKDADLATSATIYLGGYVAAIEKAVANAKALGAQAGDELVLSCIPTLASSAAGNAELDCDAVALTVKDGVITSCYLDALQAKVSIGEDGAATVANTQTKNELGDSYGMVAWAGATYEWYEQAENFAAYVTGKTPAQVAGIAVTESNKPADADLATSVTIAISGFQALIAKAAG